MESKTLSVRLPDDVREKLQKIADDEQRTLSNLIKKILVQYLDDSLK